MIRRVLFATLLLAGSFAAGSAQAQSVAASSPIQMVSILKGAGYEADLTTDDTGDPKIETKLGDWQVFILFYGCDADHHDRCDSIQFSTGFDRKEPMDPGKALSIARQYRFLAVSLDDEGDPYLRWDIITKDGISKDVFLDAISKYSDALDNASEIIFEDE